MGILSASVDKLRYDPLKDDKLNNFDPLSPQSGSVIAEYNKNFGFALMPGQKEAIDKYHQNILNRVSQQENALGSYQNAFNQKIAESDKKARGILGGLKSPVQDTVEVWIMGNNGVETKHRVNRAWADQNLPKLHDKSHGLYNPMYGNGRYEIYAAGHGKELRSMLTRAANQTASADQLGQKVFKTQKEALEYQAKTQRNSAMERYDFEVRKAQTYINATRSEWSNYIQQMRQRFEQGRRTNESGIKDLLSSGALIA